MGYIIDKAKWASIDEYKDSPKYRRGHSEEEFEAHEFAAAFLMPEAAYRHLVGKYSTPQGVNLGPIAKAFNVSVDAARMRGRWLNILSWG
jgi:Zn-dependent peptidase ImmA (M78 family)